MNLCDYCDTVSHCTAHGCIPLTECINSGQVSAAQVVAHQDAGELPPLPKPDCPNIWVGCHSPDQMRAYATAALAAERAEVVRLRVALEGAYALVLNLNRTQGTSK